MRLPPNKKALIERAALLSGVSVSSFALDAMLEKAQEVLAAAETTQLSAGDWERFLEILEDDRPSDVLVAAARRYRNT